MSFKDKPLNKPPQHLDKMFGFMKDYVHERRSAGTGTTHKQQPTKFCGVCDGLFDPKVVKVGTVPVRSLCSTCKARLDKGMIAFVCDINRRFLWASVPDGHDKKWSDLKGKIVKVTAAQMGAMDKRASGNGNRTPPPSPTEPPKIKT